MFFDHFPTFAFVNEKIGVNENRKKTIFKREIKERSKEAIVTRTL